MTRERQAMVIQHMLRNRAHQQRLDGLRAMSPEERQAFFERTDLIFARVDAVRNNNWARYLYLGGDATADNVVIAAKQGRWLDIEDKEVK